MSSPAGWYPQPDGKQRYWDGTEWTDNSAPGMAAAVDGPPMGNRTKIIIAAATGGLCLFFLTAIGTQSPDTSGVDHVAASQQASDKATSDQPAVDKAAADKSAADQVATEVQATADAQATQQAGADKVAADEKSAAGMKAAAGKVAAANTLTTAQENAKRKGESYLGMSSFSRVGLSEQLKYEGFTGKDARRAIDSMKVNWNTEAEQKAKSYVEMSGFSRSGLIEQLEYEGFTNAQAAHGADSVGL